MSIFSINNKGFSLIELMVVVAVIGILATIALPSYRAYSVRADMTNVINTYAACLRDTASFYTLRGTFPNQACNITSINAGGSGTNTSLFPSLISNVHYNHTAKAAWIAMTANSSIAPNLGNNRVFYLMVTPASGTANSEASLTVRCGWWNNGPGDMLPKQYLPSSCHEQNLVSLP